MLFQYYASNIMLSGPTALYALKHYACMSSECRISLQVDSCVHPIFSESVENLLTLLNFHIAC